MKRCLKNWRIKTPNQHRSYGEKRNRDFKKQFEEEELKMGYEVVFDIGCPIKDVKKAEEAFNKEFSFFIWDAEIDNDGVRFVKHIPYLVEKQELKDIVNFLIKKELVETNEWSKNIKEGNFYCCMYDVDEYFNEDIIDPNLIENLNENELVDTINKNIQYRSNSCSTKEKQCR